MRILVVGAGSTGGYFGARLAEAGRDVSFLVRPARAAQVRTRGLEIVSPHGDFTINPQIVTAESLKGPFDLVLMTVKSFALDAAIADCAAAIGSQSMILPVLNGMKHIDVLSARFGKEAVLGGVCKINTTLDEEGRIIHLSELHQLDYGELDGSLSARVRQLDKIMQGAGFEARLSTTIAREMWEKWLLLASLGGVNSLMRGTIGEINAAPGGSEFVLAFLDEVVAIVQKVGHAPSPAFVAFARAFLTEKNSSQTSSMYRDLRNGNSVEADQILGDLLARGRQAGIAAPLVNAAYANLCVYQNRLR